MFTHKSVVVVHLNLLKSGGACKYAIPPVPLPEVRPMNAMLSYPACCTLDISLMTSIGRSIDGVL